MHMLMFTRDNDERKVNIPGGPKKYRTLRNYNGAYTLWGEIAFGIFVDQYVLLLTNTRTAL